MIKLLAADRNKETLLASKPVDLERLATFQQLGSKGGDAWLGSGPIVDLY